MKIGKTLTVKSRSEWRTWLAENHKTVPDIWLVNFRKASGKQRVTYNDAVEEALCYGRMDRQHCEENGCGKLGAAVYSPQSEE